VSAVFTARGLPDPREDRPGDHGGGAARPGRPHHRAPHRRSRPRIAQRPLPPSASRLLSISPGAYPPPPEYTKGRARPATDFERRLCRRIGEVDRWGAIGGSGGAPPRCSIKFAPAAPRIDAEGHRGGTAHEIES